MLLCIQKPAEKPPAFKLERPTFDLWESEKLFPYFGNMLKIEF